MATPKERAEYAQKKACSSKPSTFEGAGTPTRVDAIDGIMLHQEKSLIFIEFIFCPRQCD
jgi:hypothetical protein